MKIPKIKWPLVFMIKKYIINSLFIVSFYNNTYLLVRICVPVGETCPDMNKHEILKQEGVECVPARDR